MENVDSDSSGKSQASPSANHPAFDTDQDLTLQSRFSSTFLPKLKSALFQLSQKSLFSWIKPTILGCDREYLNLEQNDLVCYVMPFRSTADLLVIDHACKNGHLPSPLAKMRSTATSPTMQDSLTIENRSFFFLGHPEGTLGRKTLREQSARMLRLFEHQAGNTQNIKIVPVSLFWGHQPDKEKSVLKLLLSENWTVTSRFRKLLAGFFHPNHILVQFSKPISLNELMEGEPDREKQIRKLLRVLRVHFNRQKQAIIGPDLSHRRTLINSIMSSATVQSAINLEISKEQETRAEIEKQALAYANEIAAHQSYRVIRFFYVLLRWLWNRLYDGIEISNIDTAKELAKSFEVIYIPCHRSHIDYLLLSYVLYQNGLTPPHIAAGKNLNLPIVGPMLRRAGAFFMRRTFHGAPLYKTVFDEYMHLMFIKGFSIEYFIEGGRSRTGRTLAPRTGMLSMTMRSFQRDSSKPIAFLPVYFGYERILEASTYMGELAGQSKKKESIFDIFGIFRTFKNTFGKVAVNFGEPLELGSFLNEKLPGWRTGDEEAKDFTNACSDLAILLAERINQAATVNPVNLVATAILCTPKQTIEHYRLESQVNVLLSIAQSITQPGEQQKNKLTVTTLTANEIIAQAEKITGITRQTQQLGDVLSAPPETSVLLTYYRNNTLHIFIIASLIARYVRFEGKITRQDIINNCMTLYPFLKAELFISWPVQQVAEKCQQILEVLSNLELINIDPFDNQQISAPEPTTPQYAGLNDLAEIVEPTLERFHIVTALLQDEKPADKQRSIKSFESAAAGIAQQLSAIYGINSPEFFDRSLFSRFITTLDHEGYIKASANNISKSEAFDSIKQHIENILDNELRYNVMQIVKQTASRERGSEKHQSDSLSRPENSQA